VAHLYFLIKALPLLLMEGLSPLEDYRLPPAATPFSPLRDLHTLYVLMTFVRDDLWFTDVNPPTTAQVLEGLAREIGNLRLGNREGKDPHREIDNLHELHEFGLSLKQFRDRLRDAALHLAATSPPGREEDVPFDWRVALEVLVWLRAVQDDAVRRHLVRATARELEREVWGEHPYAGQTEGDDRSEVRSALKNVPDEVRDAVREKLDKKKVPRVDYVEDKQLQHRMDLFKAASFRADPDKAPQRDEARVREWLIEVLTGVGRLTPNSAADLAADAFDTVELRAADTERTPKSVKESVSRAKRTLKNLPEDVQDALWRAIEAVKTGRRPPPPPA
jgi:hypothetical protein